MKLQNYPKPPSIAITEPSTSLDKGSSNDDPPILRQRKSVFFLIWNTILKTRDTGKILVFQRRKTAVVVNPSEVQDIIADEPDKTPDYSIELKGPSRIFQKV